MCVKKKLHTYSLKVKSFQELFCNGRDYFRHILYVDLTVTYKVLLSNKITFLGVKKSIATVQQDKYCVLNWRTKVLRIRTQI